MKVSLCALFVWEPWLCFSCSPSPEIFPVVFMLWQQTWKLSAAVLGSAGPCLLHPFEKHQQVPAWPDPSQPGQIPCRASGTPSPAAPCRCLLTRPLASQFHLECLCLLVTWASRGCLRMISDPRSSWGVGTEMIPILQMTKLRLGRDLLVQHDHHFYSEYSSSATPSSQGAAHPLGCTWPSVCYLSTETASPLTTPSAAHSASP